MKIDGKNKKTLFVTMYGRLFISYVTCEYSDSNFEN